MTNKNLNIASNSRKYPKLVAFWRLFVEYLGDYFNGQKYKHLHNEQGKQK